MLSMSEGMKLGVRSRRIMTIVAAVFAVAVMMAVPFLTVVESDADFTKEEAGYRYELDNPTAEELTAFEVDKKDAIWGSVRSYLNLFDLNNFSVTVTSESFIYVKAEGREINSDSVIAIYVSEITAENTVITLTAKSDGVLINPNIEDLSKEKQAAANAIKTYFGGNEVTKDETIEITGLVKMRIAEQEENEFKLLDGNKFVVSKDTISSYGVGDTDLNVKRVSIDKTIKLVSDLKGVGIDESKWEYASADIVVGTSYTVKNTVERTYKGDTYYTVDGTDYTLVKEDLDPNPDYQDTVQAEDIHDQASMKVSDSFKNKIDALPSSSGNATVDKTYDAAESAFDSVVMAAVGDDILKIILIGLGIFFGILVLIAVILAIYFVLRKKRK